MYFPQEDDNSNEDQDNDAKIDIVDTYGNESDSEDEIMLEDEYFDPAIIDRESSNCTKTTISGRVLIPPEILEDYETENARLDR